MPRDLSVNLHITNKRKAMLCGFCTVEMLVDHRLGVNKRPLSLRPLPPRSNLVFRGSLFSAAPGQPRIHPVMR